MLVIWSGLGFLTVVIVILIGAPVTALVGMALKAFGLGRYVGLAFVIGLLAAAGVNWGVGRWLNNKPGRQLIDPATGNTVILRQKHRLFFIAMEWWSVPLVAFAAIALFSQLFNSSTIDRTKTSVRSSQSSDLMRNPSLSSKRARSI